MKLAIKRAADVLLGGGVIAYPTEGVFGLGCMPDDEFAIARLLAIKARDPAKGLILITSSPDLLGDYVAAGIVGRLPDPDPAQPITWVVAAGRAASPLLRGAHPGVAVRISTNPVALGICEAVQSPIVSTSANLSGRPVVRNRLQLVRQFRHRVDFIVPGDCGPSSGPSEIRTLDEGRVLRQKTT